MSRVIEPTRCYSIASPGHFICVVTIAKPIRRAHSRPCRTRTGGDRLQGTMLKRLKEDGGAAFDPEAVRILVAAFDDAWRSVQDSGITFTSDLQADATREILALCIIDMARRGERDVHRLREYALLHLTKSNLRGSGL